MASKRSGEEISNSGEDKKMKLEFCPVSKKWTLGSDARVCVTMGRNPAMIISGIPLYDIPVADGNYIKINDFEFAVFKDGLQEIHKSMISKEDNCVLKHIVDTTELLEFRSMEDGQKLHIRKMTSSSQHKIGSIFESDRGVVLSKDQYSKLRSIMRFIKEHMMLLMASEQIFKEMHHAIRTYLLKFETISNMLQPTYFMKYSRFSAFKKEFTTEV